MNKTIKVNLSVDSLKKLTKKINNLSKDIEDINDNIIKEVIDTAYNEIQKGYAKSPYEGYNEEFTFGKDDKSAWVEGNQVIYREYGTGTQGLNDPHPAKSKASIPLNPYNSGKTIRSANITMKPDTGILPGELYWTFKKNGQLYYTTGIPSGKEVYYASKNTKEKLKEIIEKRVGEKLSKL